MRLTFERLPSFAGLYVLFLLLLVWVPIPVGSNRAWSQGLLTTIVLAIAATWALAYVRSPFELPVVLKNCRLPALLLLAWVLYPVLQLLPLPTLIFDSSNHRLAGYETAAAIDGGPWVGYLSIDRSATFDGFLRQAGLAAIFFLTIALTCSRKRLRFLMYVLVGVGFAEAFYGLALVFSGSESGLWNPGHIARNVSGTYVNQNHFAGLMELTIPVAIGLVIAGGEGQAERAAFSTYAGRITAVALDRRSVPAFLALVMVSALVMTTSRGAIVSLAAAISATFLLGAWRRGARRAELRMGVLFACLTMVSLAWLDTGGLSEKMHDAGFESKRGDLREISYRMIEDHPIVGTGVGTYRWAFPAYKDDRFGSGFYEHAHNDFLEVLGEQGLVGFSLIAGAVAVVLYRIGLALTRRRDPLARGALFASFAGCSSLLIHGLVDFNLQIPANAAYFFVLLGGGIVAANLGESDAHE